MQDREKREAARDALIEAIRQARKVMIGETLFIGIGPEVDTAIKKGLRQGKTVTENGVSQWISLEVVFHSDKPGSHAYVWDKTGNKVKHNKVLVTKTLATGEIKLKNVGTCFREWDV